MSIDELKCAAAELQTEKEPSEAVFARVFSLLQSN
jgi:hypothetical protein